MNRPPASPGPPPALAAMDQRLWRLIGARAGDLLADLRRHVGIPTGPGAAAGLDETRGRLTGRLAALGATVELAAGTVRPDWLHAPSGAQAGVAAAVAPIAVCHGPAGGGAPVLICGHLDTVHDPRSSFRELAISPDGSRATGPGCADMKGGLVVLVAALEALAETGVRARWTVVLNSDEETGSYHSDGVIRAEAARAAAAGGVGIAVEPALPGGELAVERMGSGQFMIEARGRGAHVGRDFERGVSAVTALADRLVRVAAMADPAAGRIASIGPIDGGTATNVVPDRARAWGNVRFDTPAHAADLAARLDGLATGPGELPAVVVRRSFNRPAKPQTPATERLALAARRAAEDLGQRLPFARTGGVCDGNNMQDAGLPTIDTLGVRGGGLHTPEEWIDLSSLVDRARLLAVVIARAARGELGV